MFIFHFLYLFQSMVSLHQQACPDYLDSTSAIYRDRVDFAFSNYGHGWLRIIHAQTGYYDEAAVYLASESDSILNNFKVPANVPPSPLWTSATLNWCSSNNAFRRSMCTAIKDKGSCNADWAFASVEVAESSFAIRTKATTPLVLAIEQVISCASALPKSVFGDPSIVPNVTTGKCNIRAVPVENAFFYIRNAGLQRKSEYSALWTSKLFATPPSPPVCNASAVFSSALKVKFPNYCQFTASSISGAKSNLIQYGPASVYVDASNWGNGSMIVSDATRCSSTGSSYQLEMVYATLVGWNADSTGRQYWIVRHHKGSNYGKQGFVWIYMDSINTCPLATSPNTVLKNAIWIAPCVVPTTVTRPPYNPCIFSLACPSNQVCGTDITGNKTCTNPCIVPNACPLNFKCSVEKRVVPGGVKLCTDPCGAGACPSNQVCNAVQGVKNCTNPCLSKDACPSDRVCAVVSGVKSCLDPCSSPTACSSGNVCAVVSGIKTCTNPCLLSNACDSNQICGVVSGKKLCSNPCLSPTACTTGKVCSVVSGVKTCTNPCSDLNACPSDRVCSVSLGAKVCADPCLSATACSAGKVCSVVSGLKLCTNPCSDSNACPSDRVCSVISGTKSCSDPCLSPNACPDNNVCTVNLGLKTCSDPCSELDACPSNNICLVNSGVKTCSNPCENSNTCAEGQICSVESGTQVCTDPIVGVELAAVTLSNDGFDIKSTTTSATNETFTVILSAVTLLVFALLAVIIYLYRRNKQIEADADLFYNNLSEFKHDPVRIDLPNKIVNVLSEHTQVVRV